MNKSALIHFRVKHFKVLFISLLLMAFGFIPSATAQNINLIQIVKKEISTPNDIVNIRDSLVIPYVYTNTISLNHLPVPEKKQKFFEMLLPSVLVAKTNLDIIRKQVEMLALKNTMTPADTNFLLPLMRKFGTNDIFELIKRLQTFPVSIILAQAAIESGWGSSRFFLQGNNIFGMWSFDSTENRMATLSHRNGTRIYLQKFDNLEAAIDAYYVMLDTRQIFAPFRAARTKTDNPLVIIDSLKKYSERGNAYVSDLARMIRVNHLQRFDSYKIAPGYLPK
jgi:Bax protein